MGLLAYLRNGREEINARQEFEAFTGRMDKIHEEIAAIPEGTAPGYEENYQRYMAEAKEKIKNAMRRDAAPSGRRKPARRGSTRSPGTVRGNKKSR